MGKLPHIMKSPQEGKESAVFPDQDLSNKRKNENQ